jgi:hypothetical protein
MSSELSHHSRATVEDSRDRSFGDGRWGKPE